MKQILLVFPFLFLWGFNSTLIAQNTYCGILNEAVSDMDSRFENMKGDPALIGWKSRLLLPGASEALITDQPGPKEAACVFSYGHYIPYTEAEFKYQKALADLRNCSPAGWIFTEETVRKGKTIRSYNGSFPIQKNKTIRIEWREDEHAQYGCHVELSLITFYGLADSESNSSSSIFEGITFGQETGPDPDDPSTSGSLTICEAVSNLMGAAPTDFLMIRGEKNLLGWDSKVVVPQAMNKGVISGQGSVYICTYDFGLNLSQEEAFRMYKQAKYELVSCHSGDWLGRENSPTSDTRQYTLLNSSQAANANAHAVLTITQNLLIPGRYNVRLRVGPGYR
jgi:hypothetical protein